MSALAECREDRRIAAEEVARLRAFMRAIAKAADALGDAEARLAAIRSLAADAEDLTAPVPGRVAQLWREGEGA